MFLIPVHTYFFQTTQEQKKHETNMKPDRWLFDSAVIIMTHVGQSQ